MMKKLLLFIVLGLLWSNIGFAATTCSESEYDVDAATDGKTYIKFTFTSKTNQRLKIISYGPKATDGKVMKYGPALTLPSYSIKSHRMDISNLNLNMYSKRYTWRCIHFNGVVLSGTKIKKCSETNYESPCTCEKEPNFIKKNYCEFRKKQENKMTRSEAAKYCANKAEDFSKEVGAEYYKDCMKDEGF